MVLVSNGHLSNLFLRNIGQKNVFYDIQERKNTFLGYKNKKFKMSKNWHFSKWVNPWFWSKNGHFSNVFCLGNICQENMFYDILDRKNACVGNKNKKFKKSKKQTFFHGFFPTFFFRQYRPGICFLWSSTTKKRFSRL